jgi:hypothetical protein
MGNKSEVLQAIHDRIERDMATTLNNVKQLRIGSIEDARKGVDFPIVTVSLDSGDESSNFKNQAFVDLMSVKIGIVEKKLEGLNSYFMDGIDGDGTVISVSEEIPLEGVEVDAFKLLTMRSLATEANGDRFLVFDNTITAETTEIGQLSLTFSSFDNALIAENTIHRNIKIIDENIDALVLSGASGLGFNYSNITLNESTTDDLEGDFMDDMSYRVVTVTDWKNTIVGSFNIVCMPDPSSGATSVKIGYEPIGALFTLERVLNALDLTTNGVIDLNFSGKTNGQRRFSYTLDEDSDIIMITVRADIESAIFMSGER